MNLWYRLKVDQLRVSRDRYNDHILALRGRFVDKKYIDGELIR